MAYGWCSVICGRADGASDRASRAISGHTQWRKAYLSEYIVAALDFIARCNVTIPYARGEPDHLFPPAVAS